MEGLKRWREAHPRWWGIAALTLAGLFGVGIGAASVSDQSPDEDLTAAITSLESEVASLEDDVDQAEDATREVKAKTASAVRKATAKGRLLKKEYSQKLASIEAKETQAKDELAAAERSRKDAQAELNQILRSTIKDGVWQSGVDFEPGIYRQQNSGCYWAKLSDPGGGLDSIIANNNGGNQTVTIDSAWFESSGCGKWVKLG